jgi:plastocyanin
MALRLQLAAVCSLLALGVLAAAPAEEVTVTGRLVVTEGTKGENPHGAADAVVWLSPMTPSVRPVTSTAGDTPPRRLRLVQKHKQFDPHILVVPLGSLVEFPNDDPVFHNVFSLFEGKRFDLGLYEAGSSRTVRFDRAGICYIFCNIHPEMSAVVVVVETPYYAVADKSGTVAIPQVPPGQYRLHVWYERSLPEFLSSLTREVTIAADSASLGTIPLKEIRGIGITHKNKYGRDYDAPAPPGPLYQQP